MPAWPRKRVSPIIEESQSEKDDAQSETSSQHSPANERQTNIDNRVMPFFEPMNFHTKAFTFLLLLGLASLASAPIEAELDEIADLLRKHGAKTGEELKAEGK